jgi:hypothetical protein
MASGSLALRPPASGIQEPARPSPVFPVAAVVARPDPRLVGASRARREEIVAMSSSPPPLRPIVLYVPAGSRSTARIPRGSAIVAQPRCGAHEIEVYFEGAAPGHRGMRTFADRALSASGRLLERAVFGGCLLVPPTALTVVGVVNFPTGTIELTGPHSQRAVADWLGVYLSRPRRAEGIGRHQHRGPT